MPEGPLNGSLISPTLRGGHTPGITTTFNGTDLHTLEVDDAREWEAVMAIVCQEMKIPAITSRGGLKKIHANFDDMYSRIQSMYLTCPESRRDYVRGGIAMVLSKMFMDSVLRGKLFEKGVLDLIFPLFERQRTRQLAAVALSALCGHVGFEVRLAIFQKSNYIVGFIRNSLDDFKLTLFATVTVAQCMKTVLDEFSQPGMEIDEVLQKLRESIDLIPFLETALESLKRNTTHPMFFIDQVVDLLSFTSVLVSDEIKDHLSSIRFVVAGLRSKDWGTRGKCLASLVRLHMRFSPMDQDILDPLLLVIAFERGIPLRFTQLHNSYRRESESELMAGYTLSVEYLNAVADVFLCTLDLCALGMEEAKLILKSEHSITERKMTLIHPNFPRQVDVKTDWLFESFPDSLPVCARALRERSLPGDQDLADILDIKHHLLNRRMEDTVNLGKKALKRNPHEAYFYFAVAQTYNHYHGLYAAKKGLECPNLTPSLKWLLLERAIHHGGFAGATIFQKNPAPGGGEWIEAISILKAAYTDAKTFVQTAPPDSRLMRNAASWLILLTMVMEENLSNDLQEFLTASEMIGVSEKFWEIINNNWASRKTYVYLAQKAVLENFGPARAEFLDVFEASDNLRAPQNVSTPTTDQLHDALVAWFGRIDLDKERTPTLGHGTGPPMDDRHVEYHMEAGRCNVILYLCSWCNNPSAALRKCNGCRNVQYCDRDCQRAHWPRHKQWCKR